MGGGYQKEGGGGIGCRVSWSYRLRAQPCWAEITRTTIPTAQEWINSQNIQRWQTSLRRPKLAVIAVECLWAWFSESGRSPKLLRSRALHAVSTLAPPFGKFWIRPCFTDQTPEGRLHAATVKVCFAEIMPMPCSDKVKISLQCGGHAPQ